MIARMFPIVSVATLLMISTGCSGMQSSLFGRGARCGLCDRFSTAGQALNPFRPAPGAQQAPCGQHPQGQPSFGFAPTGVSPHAAPYASPQPGDLVGTPHCGACVGSGTSCGCGSIVSGYGGVVDPYGGVTDGDAPVMSDGFYSRDRDGLPMYGETIPAPTL